MSALMRKYNHLYSIGFSVPSERKQEATAEELLAALQSRLDDLRALPPDEVLEACENLEDTYVEHG